MVSWACISDESSNPIQDRADTPTIEAFSSELFQSISAAETSMQHKQFSHAIQCCSHILDSPRINELSAVDRDTLIERATYNMAYSYEQQGDSHSSLKYYEKYKSMRPQNITTLHKLSTLYA